MKIYNDFALKGQKQVLIVSRQTAVDIDYLVELTADIEISCVTFEGAAKKFNRFHSFNLPCDVQNRREQVCRKRLSDAYYLYNYLEQCQRAEIRNYQIIKSSLEEAIMDHKNELAKAFQARWSCNHNCKSPGCPWFMVIDGGLKPWRKVCAAKLSGLRHFKDTGYTHITGCTTQPLPKSKYCQLHQNQESPVLDHSQISDDSKRKLRERRSKVNYNERAGQDTLYVIEAIHKIKHINGDKKFLVKWVGYDEDLNT